MGAMCPDYRVHCLINHASREEFSSQKDNNSKCTSSSEPLVFELRRDLLRDWIFIVDGNKELWKKSEQTRIAEKA